MSKKQHAIVSVINDLYTDQRVHKVCLFLQKQGYEVTLVGRLQRNSNPIDRPYRTIRMRLGVEKGPVFYAFFNLRLFFLLLFKRIDVLVANDLDTLLPNYLIATLRRKKLVYDSHEYFTEVPELVSRPKVQRVWERIEGFIFPKLNYIYTVNESIANRYHLKYGKNISVVRNISPKWIPTDVKTKSEWGIPENQFVLIFQGAGINIDRGAEEAVEAMHFLKGVVLLFVGDGDVIPALKKQVESLNLTGKVLFFGKRPYHELLNFTLHADLGLTLDKDTNINYRFSLPNKVFDYMHTQTPILASNILEVRKIVENYDIGQIIESHDPKFLAETIDAIRLNPTQLETWKSNCIIASNAENWENETRVLESFYPAVHG
jgi:glycosyltransferase involved in cell wall biosynthesis